MGADVTLAGCINASKPDGTAVMTGNCMTRTIPVNINRVVLFSDLQRIFECLAS